MKRLIANLKKLTPLLFTCLYSANAIAEPFIDTSNAFLRADLQLLADKGHINIPLTSYPLMWADVHNAVNSIEPTSLYGESQNAYWHVTNEYQKSVANKYSLEFHIASDESRFTSFGEENREGSFIKGNFTYGTDNWAVKLAPSVSQDDRRSHNARLDGSYIAGFLGNWVFSAGQQDRWYGPGWDTNLALTNNARPTPGLALTRKTSEPFVLPFFDDVSIPWNMNTFMSQLESDRAVPNAWLWGFRLNFKPSQNLELGVTRIAQWNGEGRSGGLSIFWDLLKGHDNCGGTGPTVEECQNGEEPGNQNGGYDIRYHLAGFNLPVSVYMQMIAEDGDRKGGLSIFGEERYMYGIDTRINAFSRNWLMYLEYADTFTDCTDGVNVGDGSGIGFGDCYYEHHTYKTGLRYQGRVIGSAYENDAKTLVFGLTSQVNSFEAWEFKAKYLDLNNDNSDRYPTHPDLGNTVTKIAEEMYVVSLKYQRFAGRFKYTLGSSLNYSSFENDDENSNIDPSLYLNIQYNM